MGAKHVEVLFEGAWHHFLEIGLFWPFLEGVKEEKKAFFLRKPLLA